MNVEVITSIRMVYDSDKTVALFEINKVSEGQNEPFDVVMNYEGNPDLIKVHQWLTENNQEIPSYSSYNQG